MKIEFKSSHGTPQFIVSAENDQERQVLSMFIDWRDKHQENRFHMHGYCYSCDHSAVTSFNFGYVKPYKKPFFKRLIQLFKP